ncbi:S-adenosyl-L-methionine-dependent methyltransferase [Serendipita vermifera]|nr:S-adenosyl-L-methionine-dependent methyltransferase [Serendipita vermifera]
MLLRNVVRRRGMATLSNVQTSSPFAVFDRAAKRIQRDRAALKDGGESSRTVDYLRNEVAERMIERLLDIKRTYNNVLDIGSGPGHFSKLIESKLTKKVTLMEMSDHLLRRDPDYEFEVPVERICADEESFLTAVQPGSQEAVVSCLSLHWVNDLPGFLVQVRESLRPDGFLLAAMLGGDTLFELRTALQVAELEREGGISPHVSPMADTRDISNLLGRAGFTMLTVDIEDVTVSYPSMFELLQDLGDMGEGNAIIGSRPFMHRDTLMAAAAAYKALHGTEDGNIPATFQIIFLIGWKPMNKATK